MEYLNRIELAGVVGTIRKQTFSDRMVAKFSMVTNYSYKDKSGCPVIESTWLNVAAWQNDKMPDLNKIERGAHLKVEGRLRAHNYVSNSGEQRTFFEVLATTISILP